MMNSHQGTGSVADGAGSEGGTPAITYADMLTRNMKAARARSGINQERLAARMRALGFDAWVRQTVARVEGGKRRLTAEEVFGLAIALEVSITYLMKLAGHGEMITLPSGAKLPIEVARELFWAEPRRTRPVPTSTKGPCPWRQPGLRIYADLAIPAKRSAARSELCRDGCDR